MLAMSQDHTKATNEGKDVTLEEEATLPPMDFSTFIMSLGSSALMNLGAIPVPGSDVPDKNLPAAKQVIDILGILCDKTRGNLDEAEKKLLESLLYDLRVQFVDAQKG